VEFRDGILRFGPFELDPDREELRRAGLALHIPRQPLRVLILLARRAGQTVTRDEIQHELWGEETFVAFDQGINSAIRHIRFHLGDNAEAPRYLRTIPRKGYVFIAPVERLTEQPASAMPVEVERDARPPMRWRAIGSIAAIILAATVWHAKPRAARDDRCVIAIRPFEIIGRAPAGLDARAFTEELFATTAALPQKRIAIVDGSSALRASITIEGTIQATSDGARVLVTATDTASRAQLWGRTYERPRERVSGLAIETAHGVAREIASRHLPPPRHEPLVRSQVSKHAFDLYRRGRAENNRPMPDVDHDLAARLFEQAAREEPKFAEAWSALSDLWGNRVLRGAPELRTQAAARAVEYAKRALALQPDNAEARSTLGVMAAQHDFDLATAEAILQRAVADDPLYVDAHFNLALTRIARGNFFEALTELEIARELDPVQFDSSPAEAHLYLLARRYDDALARYRDLSESRPGWTHVQFAVLSAYMGQRRWDKAIEVACEIGHLPLPAEKTEAAFRKIHRQLEPAVLAYCHRGAYPNEYQAAVYYAEAGDVDRTFAILDRAVATRLPNLSFVAVDPRFDAVRNDVRFRTLVARLDR